MIRTNTILVGSDDPCRKDCTAVHRSRRWFGCWIALPFCTFMMIVSEVGRSEDRWESARALIQSRCVDCHGPDTSESHLRLDSHNAIVKGGDFGTVVEVGAIEKSELLKRITTRNAEKRMPPDGEPMTEEEVQLIRDWLVADFPWEASSPDDHEQDKLPQQHWAWQTIDSNKPFPEVSSSVDGSLIEPIRSPIDAFVRAELKERGLKASPPADRVTLIRRLSYDLLGLPPTLEEIDEFVGDKSVDAYEKVVDRMLDSPRYGERWARHWLDVVHYGDTHGYDKDKPRENAWPYRDYVIRSLNSDKPYAEFVMEQIAGDVADESAFQSPWSGDRIVATGFLAAGPWDLIGHEEVPETKTDGKIARHLDRDDMVANTIGTFCSVTIHCAQCHNHKFDPISQDDYYSLQAVFAAIDRSERPYANDSEELARYVNAERRFHDSQKGLEEVRNRIHSIAGDVLSQWETSSKTGDSAALLHGGYHSALSESPEQVKWVQIDLGEAYTIRQVALHPCYDDYKSIGAGFGFPLEYRVEASNDASFQGNVTLIAQPARGGRPGAVSSKPSPMQSVDPVVFDADVRARYVRVTATELASRRGDFIFALAECEVRDDRNENVALHKGVSSLDSIESPDRWQRTNLVDGASTAIQRTRNGATTDELFAKLQSLVGDDVLAQYQTLQQSVSTTKLELAETLPTKKVYAASTDKRKGVPRSIFVLSRGNVLDPRSEVGPGALSMISQLPSRFPEASIGAEGNRRVALAKWIADPSNPLTWRSIANRVWQYHFGVGLVATSSDFGRMGAQPTHLSLLDWMADQLKASDGSLKSLHRQILLSATYRQSSQATAEHLKIDSSNQYLARFSRWRLDAESIRDSVLMSAGNLQLSMGGPGWRDFVMERPEHSPHYRYDLADPEDRSTWRRSIYRFIVRSQTNPFMTTLDCADPSMRVERRNVSITPLQSLSMLNSDFMLAQSQWLAKRIQKAHPDQIREQVREVFRQVLVREPSIEEFEIANELAGQAGLENVCRTLMNLNEFTFVD